MRRIGPACVVLGLAGCEWFDNGPVYETVRVELRSDDIDALAETSEVLFEMQYLDCLADFYAENPEARLDGGRHAPTDFRRRLCNDDSLGATAQCVVTELQQALDSAAPSLWIRFAVTSDALQGKRFAIGPLPDADTAGCDDDERAEVRLVADTPTGSDGNGVERWISVEDPAPTLTVGRASPVVVNVQSVGP